MILFHDISVFTVFSIEIIHEHKTYLIIPIYIYIYIYIYIRDASILNFSADSDSRLFKMVLIDTDADSYVRVKICCGGICASAWRTAPKRLLCSMHKAHAADPRHSAAGVKPTLYFCVEPTP